MATFSVKVVNLTENEKELQAIIREIGKNEPTISQQNRFADTWNRAIDELCNQNPRLDMYAAGRILHQVCEQARNE